MSFGRFKKYIAMLNAREVGIYKVVSGNMEA